MGADRSLEGMGADRRGSRSDAPIPHCRYHAAHPTLQIPHCTDPTLQIPACHSIALPPPPPR